MGQLFLGLDSSTQGLTAIAIDWEEKRIAGTLNVNYDRDLPEYGTVNGVRRGDDPRVVHAPPLLWAAALDRLLGGLKAAGIDPARVTAIAGSGQQHGSVYLNAAAAGALAGLDPARPLADQLAGIFSRATAPVWMDSSTRAQCEAITAALGGREAVCRLTGSTAFERFTGPQIRKFYEEDPAAYDQTERIPLVSSFMASLLLGAFAPTDHGDGAGMNLMDIAGKDWAPAALEATAPDLARRLGPLTPSDRVLGQLAPYFVKRYGFAPATRVVAWSGDNPCSLIGTGLVGPGRICISLGTSDTYFGFMQDLHTDPRGEGHVFGSPTGDYMTLICFKNGSLAREAVRDAAGLDWAGFAAALEASPPGNSGRLLLPYFEPEIVPNVLEPGVKRYRLESGDKPANARAVVEAQMMSMYLHSRWMGAEPESIYVTGGASRNRAILQVMADVNGAAVYQFETSNSAALGAALRAAHAGLGDAGRAPDWPATVADFTRPVAGSRVDPDPKARALYRELVPLYQAAEAHALQGGPDPSADLEAFAARHGG